jgi:hypothetical protein
MPSKLSSPSKHGYGLDVLYARKISPLNKNDYTLTTDVSAPAPMSQGRLNRLRTRTKALEKSFTGDEKRDQRTLNAHNSIWQAQEQLRLAGWNGQELSNLSKNYKEASQYHFQKGNYTKASHFDHLAKAATKEATTAKRVATAAQNKADRAARVKAASDRVAAKQAAKASKPKTSTKTKSTKSTKK